jgi:hypothetical protein
MGLRAPENVDMAFVSDLARWIAGVRAVVDGTPRTAASVNAGLTDLASRTKWLNDRFAAHDLGGGHDA